MPNKYIMSAYFRQYQIIYMETQPLMRTRKALPFYSLTLHRARRARNLMVSAKQAAITEAPHPTG